MNYQERKFVQTVLEYYRNNDRRHLPWRKTRNPYRILVSEVMLQQTQVERVIPKYKAFIKQFSSCSNLSSASLAEVLRAWQGLGYNRRAKMLHQSARVVMAKHNGVFPRTLDDLMELPGVGTYTAGAVMAFAYNTPIPIIETNIRTVYLHHFFKKTQGVDDKDVVKVVARTLPSENVREWYAALMDYGSYLKKKIGNQNVRSKTYKKQILFTGSDREIRGKILQLLTHEYSRPVRCGQVYKDLASYAHAERVESILEQLLTEGLVVKKGRVVLLPT